MRREDTFQYKSRDAIAATFLKLLLSMFFCATIWTAFVHHDPQISYKILLRKQPEVQPKLPSRQHFDMFSTVTNTVVSSWGFVHNIYKYNSNTTIYTSKVTMLSCIYLDQNATEKQENMNKRLVNRKNTWMTNYKQRHSSFPLSPPPERKQVIQGLHMVSGTRCPVWSD